MTQCATPTAAELRDWRRQLAHASSPQERYRLGNEVFKCAVALRSLGQLSPMAFAGVLQEIDAMLVESAPGLSLDAGEGGT